MRAGLGGGVILQLSPEQRATPLELAEDVAAEARVFPQELLPPALARRGARPAVAAHARLDERQRLDRPDERVPLEELPLLPEQPVELGGLVGAEAAPEDEMLRPSDGRDRVELEEPEPAHRLEHAA